VEPASGSVLAWTYYIQRDMPTYAHQQRARIWRQRPYRKPTDMTVGLLGLGALGAASARRLTNAGFRVVGWSRSPKHLPDVEALSGEEDLAAVLSMSDVVVCLMPLTSETREQSIEIRERESCRRRQRRVLGRRQPRVSQKRQHALDDLPCCGRFSPMTRKGEPIRSLQKMPLRLTQKRRSVVNWKSPYSPLLSSYNPLAHNRILKIQSRAISMLGFMAIPDLFSPTKMAKRCCLSWGLTLILKASQR